MESIHNLLKLTRRGDADHTAELIAYLEGFDHIVLRGAGKFGSAFGAFLLKKGFSSERLCYWDMRAEELQQVNGIRVYIPFSTSPTPELTLIVNCIPNGSLSGSVGKQEFAAKGYFHHLSGMALFEALMCSMRPETGFDARVCIETTFCNWCACERLPSLLSKQCKQDKLNDFSDELVFPLATFVVNQKCTLKCTHCGQYINHYPAQDRINFPLQRIMQDIDKVLDAVDAIGYVSLIGGEPFLHPELSKIVDHILSKPNFGVLGITTNGICDISDTFLASLDRTRTRLIFSDYTAALDDKQRKLFDKNLQKVAAAGISHTVGQPIWATPPSLRKLNLPEATRRAMKAGCNSRLTCKTIQNGVYYPCSTTAGTGSHHLADFDGDWVDLDCPDSASELRQQILQVDAMPCYESCDHCGEGGELLPLAGTQGVGAQYVHFESLRTVASGPVHTDSSDMEAHHD